MLLMRQAELFGLSVEGIGLPDGIDPSVDFSPDPPRTATRDEPGVRPRPERTAANECGRSARYLRHVSETPFAEGSTPRPGRAGFAAMPME